MYSSTLGWSLPLPADLPFAFRVHARAAERATLVDQRDPRGVRYPLAPRLALAVCAKLAGHQRLDARADWARLRAPHLAKLCALKRPTMPHPSTWSRVFGAAVNVRALEQVLSRCFQATQSTAEVPTRGSITLAVDGKTLRGTIPAGSTRGVHVVAAYLPEVGVVLAQLAVERKEHESVAVPQLLAQLDRTGVVVVGDAMQCQRTRSTQIVEAGGDYLWFVKDNQPTFHADIAHLFTPLPALPGTSAPALDCTTARQVGKGHGRLEERVITVSSLLQDQSDWPYLAQVFKLERRVWQGVQCTCEVRQGITSLPRTIAPAKRLLTIARAAWGSEHGLHYRRDVTLGEDARQTRRGVAPQVIAALNNAVIGLVQLAGEPHVPAAQRRFAYHVDQMLGDIAV